MQIYLPLEDNMILGELPKEQKLPGAQYFFEMRTVHIPYPFPVYLSFLPLLLPLCPFSMTSKRQELEGYHPIWVSNHFLQDAKYNPNLHTLQIGKSCISALYVDCNWLDLEALRTIYNLAQNGLPVVVKNWNFKQPGFVKSKEFSTLREALENILYVQSCNFMIYCLKASKII
jgi:hypothetical protein